MQGGSGSAAVCGTGAHRLRRASQEASAGPWGLRVVLPGLGGGGSPVAHGSATKCVVAAAAGGMGRVTVLGGVGPGGPLRRGRGGRGDTVPGKGGWLVRGGWPLVVHGVCGWSARWLPSHSLVLFVHGGLWPRGAG